MLLHELPNGRPDAVAVSRGADVRTFAELDQASRRVAGWLLSRGVRRGDRVIAALPPSIDVPALLYGCSRIGAVYSLLHDTAPASVIEHVVADAEPKLVVEPDELPEATTWELRELPPPPLAV